MIVACASSGLSRYDMQPGRKVDESALNLKFPMCLTVEPSSLRLTDTPAGNGLRTIIWTRRDGSTRKGKWYMATTSNTVTNPTFEQITIYVDWLTIKDNLVLKSMATLLFVGALTDDEDTPNRFWSLSEFEPCKD